MSNNVLAAIFTPIVVAIALTGWISAVYYANAHPQRRRRKEDIKTEVAGGAFRALHGGRQLMPIPGDWTQDIPAPRGATASESYDESQDWHQAQPAEDAASDLRSADDETRPMAGLPPR